jgi:hypothetical protein
MIPVTISPAATLVLGSPIAHHSLIDVAPFPCVECGPKCAHQDIRERDRVGPTQSTEAGKIDGAKPLAAEQSGIQFHYAGVRVTRLRSQNRRSARRALMRWSRTRRTVCRRPQLRIARGTARNEGDFMSRAHRNPTDKPRKPQIRNDILAQTGCAHGHVTSPALRRRIPIPDFPETSIASSPR